MIQRPTITTLDIETAPITAYVWGLFKQNVGLNQIVRDWSIMSLAWKHLGEDEVYYQDVSHQADLRDDADLLVMLWHVLDEADVIIGQNVRRFDTKKINARFLEAGLPPPSPYVMIDTLEMAKDAAAFTSNKLDWLSQKLARTHKDHHNEFPGMDLWVECLKGNPRAWAAMRGYNIPDVASTEEVYLMLRPYYRQHPNLAIFADDEQTRCPRCLSVNIHLTGDSTFTNVSEYKRYRCADCGGFSRSRYTINSKAKRQATLTPN
jgi:hypothetical protein